VLRTYAVELVVCEGGRKDVGGDGPRKVGGTSIRLYSGRQAICGCGEQMRPPDREDQSGGSGQPSARRPLWGWRLAERKGVRGANVQAVSRAPVGGATNLRSVMRLRLPPHTAL